MTTAPTLPPHLVPRLAQLVQQRYAATPQDEAAAGWRGLIEACGGRDDGQQQETHVAAEDIGAESTVFLIDHLWCTTLFAARQQLATQPVIRGNLCYVCGVEEAAEEEEEKEEEETRQPSGSWSDNDNHNNQLLAAVTAKADAFLQDHTTNHELDLDNLLPRRSQAGKEVLLTLLAAIPRVLPDLETLSLRDTHLDGAVAPALRACLQSLPHLKAVWLNDNPDLCDEKEDPFPSSVFDQAMLEGQLQLVNRKLTPGYDGWALRYLGDVGGNEEEEEEEEIVALDLAGRGLSLLQPAAFAQAVPHIRRLDLRRNPGLDPTDLLPTLAVLPRLQSLWVDVSTPDEEEKLACGAPQLGWVNGRSITRPTPTTVVLSETGGEMEECIDRILSDMWPYVEPMRLSASPDAHAEVYWYLMDLPGLSIPHASPFSSHHQQQPNLTFAAMHDRALGVTFTVAWPVREIKKGEAVCRNVLADFPPLVGEEEEDVLKALWGRTLWRKRRRGQHVVEERERPVPTQPQAASPPPSNPATGGPPPLFPPTPPTHPLLVYTDMPIVYESLSLPSLFAFTDDPSQADLLWATPSFFSSSSSSLPAKPHWKSTLPNLHRLDDKCALVHLLTHPPTHPPWLPRTYCLPEDLSTLLLDWKDNGETWILKPPHLARGWDIVLTRSLSSILRHLQASVRLAVSIYLPNPDLWVDGHKYDLRFYLLLLSPTQVLIHPHFRVRRAIAPYSLALNHLQEFGRHLTNTTLGLVEEKEEGGKGCPTETLSCEEFVKGFAALHPGVAWEAVRRRIEQMLGECMGLLAQEGGGGGGGGLGRDAYGRVLIGVDVLLEKETLSPYLIEMNDAPNVIGILSERPAFMNEVFTAAFVPEEGGGEEGGFRPLQT